MKRLLYPIVAIVGLTTACNSSNTTSETNSRELRDSTVGPMVSRPMDINNPDPAHNSQNSIDWMGVYEATLPCADCPGIKTIVTLHEDETFEIRGEYLERDTKFSDQGTFEWQENGSVVHLKGEETNIRLKVGENVLFQLDEEGKEMTGTLTEHYIFKKQL